MAERLVEKLPSLAKEPLVKSEAWGVLCAKGLVEITGSTEHASQIVLACHIPEVTRQIENSAIKQDAMPAPAGTERASDAKQLVEAAGDRENAFHVHDARNVPGNAGSKENVSGLLHRQRSSTTSTGEH